MRIIMSLEKSIAPIIKKIPKKKPRSPVTTMNCSRKSSGAPSCEYCWKELVISVPYRGISPIALIPKAKIIISGSQTRSFFSM
jgi:hypothetical protein